MVIFNSFLYVYQRVAPNPLVDPTDIPHWLWRSIQIHHILEEDIPIDHDHLGVR
jgi:hypothetical protein